MALLSYDIVAEILEVADKYSEKQQQRLERLAEAVKAEEAAPEPEAVPVPADSE